MQRSARSRSRSSRFSPTTSAMGCTPPCAHWPRRIARADLAGRSRRPMAAATAAGRRDMTDHLSALMLAVAVPSPTQCAVRRAWAVMLQRASLAHSAFLDADRNPTDRHDPLNVNPWRVDVVRIDGAGFDEFLDLSDRDSARSGSGRIEIAGATPIDQVSESITLVSVHEGVIGHDRMLQNVSCPVEFAGLLRRAGDG